MEAEPLPALALDTASDDQLALRARELYRESGIPQITPDALVSPNLERGERVLGLRPSAVIRRVDVEGDARAVVSEEGPLYVTDQRLLHIGAGVTSTGLHEIDELAMADDRILLTLVGSRGLTVDVANPHQLRALIAAAKAANRHR